MSDIFISYKREEQAIARNLANAFEDQGWTVWWDPKLRAGEHFDELIEKALNEAKCVIVMWSERSVQSRYVRDEATYALEKGKLVPVAIENVTLPFRFKGVHTLSLLGWDGSKDFSEFRRLVEDISSILGPSTEILEPGTVFRDKLKDGSQGPEMVVISAGTFRMGDINGDGDEWDQPVHTVRITKPFAIGRYQVTFEEYDQFAAPRGLELPNDMGWGRGRLPVISVCWNDARDYSEWLSQQTAKRYRLPTEAEWENAARAGTETTYWWGNEMKSGMANAKHSGTQWSGKQSAPVGSFKSNPFGLYDTAGNVWEFVQDCWHDNYNGAPTDGSAWKATGGRDFDYGERVLRGGSWYHYRMGLRSSGRIPSSVFHRSYTFGFRLARDVN